MPSPLKMVAAAAVRRSATSSCTSATSTSTLLTSTSSFSSSSSSPAKTAARRLALLQKNLSTSSKGQKQNMPYTRKHKISVIGSGNWGSAIAKIIGENAKEHSDLFEPEVLMWVFEEQYQLASDHPLYDPKVHSSPQKLSALVNTLHENVKYLPNIALPHNVVATPDIKAAVADATILIFNVPHQFVGNICTQITGAYLPYARAVSCIKGVDVAADGISLFSDVIGRRLGIYCGALSGANIASEVALEKFSETTIAYSPAGDLTPPPEELAPVDQAILKHLFHRPYFHVRTTTDVAGVSLGGALKNVVALAAGFVDGLGWGDNAKAAIMRVGLLEMRRFGMTFFADSCKSATFTEESCGVADLITSCAGGRNARCAKLSVQQGKSIEQIEKEVLNGQKLQGTSTAVEVNQFLKQRGMEDEYPLLTAVYRILIKEAKVEDLPSMIEKSN